MPIHFSDRFEVKFQFNVTVLLVAGLPGGGSAGWGVTDISSQQVLPKGGRLGSEAL